MDQHRVPRPVMALLLAGLIGALVCGAGWAPAGADGGGAVWPLQPRPPVVRGFDPPDSAWGSGHRGVDLLGRPGQEVHAAKAGRITFADRLAGRGVVVVSHGALRTTYEPVSPGVQRGDTVSTGEVIGQLQTGRSHCFPRACLHWGLLRGETYLNPLILVGMGPVRLKPLAGATNEAARFSARVDPRVPVAAPVGGLAGAAVSGGAAAAWAPLLIAAGRSG